MVLNTIIENTKTEFGIKCIKIEKYYSRKRNNKMSDIHQNKKVGILSPNKVDRTLACFEEIKNMIINDPLNIKHKIYFTLHDKLSGKTLTKCSTTGELWVCVNPNANFNYDNVKRFTIEMRHSHGHIHYKVNLYVSHRRVGKYNNNVW
ncbi:unnamed protein product, partial [marine sediment metagenome]